MGKRDYTESERERERTLVGPYLSIQHLEQGRLALCDTKGVNMLPSRNNSVDL